MSYEHFLNSKRQIGGDHGFEPLWMPDMLFDFQKSLVEWATRKGRSAIFADCGLGKTFMQLVWAENVVRKTNGRVLILTPIAVGHQTKHEGEKIGVEVARCRDGVLPTEKIVVANYERLHYFNKSDFVGVVCDESSILKNFDGATKAAVTEFMRTIPYRLLCTATAAPNDYIELGTSSEAVGELGHLDMLQKFFKADNDAYASGGGSGARRFSKNPFGGKWRFRGHAERDFWRWVCSWARAMRKPSDLGFDNGRFVLQPLHLRQHTVKAKSRNLEYLFDLPAHGLAEQRDERRRTLEERCEMAAELVGTVKEPVVCWCSLNDEGDLLTKLIPGAQQVSGNDADEEKENLFSAFEKGDVRVLVTKPTIAGFGLNWQHCARQTHFPTHSYEQWYQSIRRSWRFGQTQPVTVDMIASEGEASILSNLQRKADAAERMFEQLVQFMRNELRITQTNKHTNQERIPTWL